MRIALKDLKVLMDIPANSKSAQAYNKIIRLCWPGGEQLINALTRVHEMQRGRVKPDPALQDILENLTEAKAEIVDSIKDNVLLPATLLDPDESEDTQALILAAAYFGQEDIPITIPQSKILLHELMNHSNLQLSKKYRYSHTAIAKMRKALGLPPYISKPRVDWDKYDNKLGTMTDKRLAALIGCSPDTIRARRKKLKIDKFNPDTLDKDTIV